MMIASSAVLEASSSWISHATPAIPSSSAANSASCRPGSVSRSGRAMGSSVC